MKIADYCIKKRKNRASRGIIADIKFFEEVDIALKKYINNKAFLENFLDNLNIERRLQLDALNSIFIIFMANEEGYIDCNWDKYFSLKPEKFIETSKTWVGEISREYPDIIKKWDKAVGKDKKEPEPERK